MAQREPKPEDIREPRPEATPGPRLERGPEPAPETGWSVTAASLARAGVGLAKRALALVLGVVDYVFFLVYVLLGIRLVLTLLGAREGAAFTQLIHRLTDPLYAPFDAILSRPKVDGGFLDLPILIALMAYGVLHLALHGLIRAIKRRSSAH
jgi:uncharacterized protein YggT (Ycf19 family)